MRRNTKVDATKTLDDAETNYRPHVAPGHHANVHQSVALFLWTLAHILDAAGASQATQLDADDVALVVARIVVVAFVILVDVRLHVSVAIRASARDSIRMRSVAMLLPMARFDSTHRSRRDCIVDV